MANRKKGSRVAFVSTRISGTDGVSLEIDKWATVLERMGVECFYITGQSDRPADRTALIEEASFNHPEILDISEQAFHTEIRSEHLTNEIKRMTRVIRDKLNRAIRDFRIGGIIPENALAIPMNIPLGIAIVECIQEMAIGCMAHHHDFYWERDRFLVNSVKDLLRYAFPPALPQIRHVVTVSRKKSSVAARGSLVGSFPMSWILPTLHHLPMNTPCSSAMQSAWRKGT